ncbi:MAG: NAD(P)/FAD-dependent oxidoreductase [Promethearchaeota archaeon]|nr:MAG: NAD(P)/FAD-dependent oxidoreductase [Candidatus Lokiarchaeota archaeon]
MEPLKKDFDVIVVGAGTGGTIAARFAAKEGLNVCLIERKSRTLKPAKICGDAVGKEIFDILNISHPKGEELSCHIKGAKLYTPNRQKSITMIDPKQTGYIIDRLLFGQRLLKEALDAGVNQFLDRTTALDLIYDKSSVAGVKIRLENGEKVDLNAKIVIDASGLYSPLRKKIKSELIENNFEDKDAILCFREIVKFPTQAQEVKDLEYISIILDQEKAPGGYIWYFPKNKYALNIGLGVYMDYGGKVKDLYRENVFKEFIKTDKIEILSSGGGVAPVRRPLWSCADDGIMFVGDAALQVNPLHGGGIDPSMRGGYYAALTAVKAIENEDYSLNTLWEYNVKVMQGFGSEFAGLDLLRRVLQSLSNADLNFGLEKNLLTASEILEIAETGDLSLSLWDMAFKAFKGISRPDLLLDLNYLRIHMNEIIKLYRNFPEEMNMQQFESWKLKINEEYEKIRKMIVDTKEAKK